MKWPTVLLTTVAVLVEITALWVIWSGALRGGRSGSDAAPDARLVPPRAVAKAPVVGATWRKRGIAYWARRVSFTAAMVVAVGWATLALGAFFTGLRAAISGAGFVAALSADVMVTLASGYRAFVTFRSPGYGSLPLPAWKQKLDQWMSTLPRMLGLVAAQILAISFAIAWLGLVGIVIGTALSYGPAFVILLRSFLPVLDFERPARRTCAPHAGLGPGSLRS